MFLSLLCFGLKIIPALLYWIANFIYWSKGLGTDIAARSEIESSQRVLGGHDAFIQQFPFMVTVWVNNIPDCGGSIINPRWVLTAAHCLERSTLYNVDIRAGTNIAKTTKGLLFKPVRIKIHKNYNKYALKNDIALIKVNTPFLYSQNISEVKLAPKDIFVPPYAMATVVGWGMTKEFNDNSYPDILQTANIPIIDSEECQMIYGLDMVNENMICAGFEKGGVDACTGDSGGPLIFGNFQIGIVSFGRHCGHARNPGVYSKVAHYREWIDGIVGV